MHSFVTLFENLDGSTKTTNKINALVDYFKMATPEDAIWTVALLIGNRPKRKITTGLLKEILFKKINIPEWLFIECYNSVGDLGETIALLLPKNNYNNTDSIADIIFKYSNLNDEEEKIDFVKSYWETLDSKSIFLFNKIIGGSFRVGVSKAIVIKALAIHNNLPEAHIAHCLMGNWSASNTTVAQLLSSTTNVDSSKPYPFCLAPSLDIDLQQLGDVHNWQIEYKYDGIRGQIIVRDNQLFVWSRGEELLTDKFPEFNELVNILPNGTVIDGEILPIIDGKIMTFVALQKRIGRKNITKNILDTIPVTMIAYDLLEADGIDIRNEILQVRRAKLEAIISNQNLIQLSETIAATTWQEVTTARQNAKQINAEGVMLKNKQSTYTIGRKRDVWYKWKVEPMVIDAVLLYAQKGTGRRADLFTDYTFALWDANNKLVPIAKAYSGLTDKEINEVDAWVKKNTLEKFGPVRSVTPELVFEIAFEDVQLSTRHKSGVAVRFPRISRWRQDKKKEDANTLAELIALLESNK